MFNEEFQEYIWQAGEIVPSGTYVRVDDERHRMVTLDCQGPLPATFDGHIALYRAFIRVSIGQKPIRRQLALAQA